MEELQFVKLGGSLITDKRRRYHVHRDILQSLAAAIAEARRANPALELVIGHGSVSFGHVAARESGYSQAAGHPSPLAMAQVGAAASALNQAVRTALVEAGVPAISLPPSATARLHDDGAVALEIAPFRAALARGLVPLTFGDVVMGGERLGAIASTEALFRVLTEVLRPRQLLLLGTVEGVLAGIPDETHDTPLIPEITPGRWDAIRTVLGGSHGTDVTGGMLGKVAEMLALVQAVPGVRVRIVDGRDPGLLTRLLLDPDLTAGTLIHAP